MDNLPHLTNQPKPPFDWRELLRDAARAAVFAAIAVLAAKFGLPNPLPAPQATVQVTAYPGATVNAVPADSHK